MRIIAGIHRHRRILGPREGDLTTRPILDRVKQALFDRLWAMGLFPEPAADGTIVPDGYALDIFAGTGSLGLEALSRGCAHCTFIERDRYALGALKQNIAALQLDDQATVLPTDALAGVYLGNLRHKPLRLVFLDPPYALMSPAESEAGTSDRGPSRRSASRPDKVYALLAMLGQDAFRSARPGYEEAVGNTGISGIMEKGGVVVLRVPERTEIRPVPGFADPVIHAYGKMLLAFYHRK